MQDIGVHTVNCSTVQYSTVQYSAVLYSSTVQYSTVSIAYYSAETSRNIRIYFLVHILKNINHKHLFVTSLNYINTKKGNVLFLESIMLVPMY